MKKWISCILVMVMTISIFGTLPANAENSSLEPNSQMETDISVRGTNSFGNLLTNELTAEMDKQEENNGCNIFSIEMNGTDATVSFETTENCTLVIAVYDESGEQMLASGNTAVVKGETEALVTIDTDSMPQYYYLRGFLVDSDTLRPVCTVYESPNYTQEMQAFFAKTVNDFDSEKVLNLDESESNNFAVFSNETIIIEQNGTTNRVTKADDSTRTYVIANADNTVKSLKNGDVFTCKNSDETLIVKVDNISVSGSTVTINSQDTSAEEVFDYVKIDTTVQNAEISQKRSSVQSNDLYTDKEPKIYGAGISKEIKPSCTKSVEFSTPEISQYFTVGVSGGIEMTVSAPIKFYYNFKSLKEQYLYTEFKIEYVSKIFAAIDGEAKLPIDLGEFNIPTPYGINIGVTVTLEIGVTGKTEVNGTVKGSIGFSYDSDENKARDISSLPEFNSEFKTEAGVFLTVSVKPNINFLNDDIADIDLALENEIEAKGEKVWWELKPDENEKHECKECIEGEINRKVSAFFNVKLKKRAIFKNKLNEIEEKWCDFYYSLDKDEFGFGMCPYKQYRVNVRAVDNNHIPISEASIIENNPIGDIFLGKTDSNGNLEIWLSNGDYTLTAKKDDQTVSRNITVYDNPKSVLIRFKLSVAESNSNSSLKIRQLVLGDSLSAAITEDGSLYTWGSNGLLQLGNGTEEDSLVPIKIMDNVKDVTIGDSHSAAITEDGSLYMWGWNYDSELGNGISTKSSIPIKVLDNVKEVSLGDSNSAAITEDGNLYMWGNNKYGKLGNGTTKNSSVPIKIMDNVKSVSLSYNYSAAITEDGSLYMWGANWCYQLGNGTSEDSLTPIKIMDNVKSVSLGSSHNAAITEDGSLYMWGYNDRGQIGNGTTNNSSTPVKIMDNVKAVSLGSEHSGALTEDGSLYTWGNNFYNQLGYSTAKSSTPTKVIDNIKSIIFVGSQSSAIAENGRLYIWGRSSSGTLDDVALVAIGRFSYGKNHFGIIKTDETLYMWGDNGFGQLGNGTTEDSTTPIKIEISPINTSTVMANLNLSETASSGLYSAAPLNLTQSPTLLAENYSTATAKSYQGLSPNMVYNFYVMKSETAESSLSSDNLLYITQAVSDANGNLEIPYIAKEQYENAVTLVKAASKTDLSSAQVTIPDILCNGAEQFAEPEVTLNREMLTEGVDYDIEKRYSAIYPGEYELIITGIRNYTGEVSATYKIYCNHNFANNKCTICKSLKDTVGDANGDGVVGIADLVALQDFLVVRRKDISINADVNQDGVINVFDMCLLRRIVSDVLS